MHSGLRSPVASRRSVFRSARWLAAAGILATTTVGHAATITWKGHTWQVTSGGMAGVCQGSPANVMVDSQDYLHLRISKDGNTWSAAELFTTDRLGFGTYQWQTDGPIDSYDRNIVLGLFPYGPQANIGTDGTNEIDIEYSRWGVANGVNGDFTDYPASGTTIGEHSFTFSLEGGALATSRFAWSATNITSSLLAGAVAVDETSALLETWTHAPPNPSTNIPQQPLPLGMNLWCFDAPPSDGEPVEIVIRDFVFVPEDAASGGQGGEAGASPTGGKAGTAGDGGRTASSGTGGAGGDTGGRAGATAGGRGSGAGAGGNGGVGNAAGGRAGGEPLGAGRGGASAAGASAAGASAAGASAAGASAAGASAAGASAAGASAGASGASPAAGGTRTSAATQPSNDRSTSCGCRTSGSTASRAALPLFGALLGLTLRRRRRTAVE